MADVPNISAAGLLVTYWCNARCAHCYERSSPERRGWMSPDDAGRHFAALGRLGLDPAAIHIGGGEPFGDFPRLLEILDAARQAGLDGLGYVETNGYWATDDRLVAERLQALQLRGVRQISISADVYHQAFVDPAAPQRLASMSRDLLGSRGLRVRRWKSLQSPIDLRNADAATRRAAYVAAMQKFPERFTGRAADELAPLVAGCPVDQFSGEHCRKGLAESAHVHVDPQGFVFPGTCAGLALGRATADLPLDALLAAPRRPVWQTLADGGPAALVALAAPLGFQPAPRGYADKCHLCTATRRWLREQGHFADELTPAELYME